MQEQNFGDFEVHIAFKIEDEFLIFGSVFKIFENMKTLKSST